MMTDTPPPPATPAEPTPTPIPSPARKIGGIALAALIVGGVAFLFGLVPYFGVLVAITAIVLAIVALVKRQTPRWMPLVGGGAAVVALIAGLIITAIVANGIRTPIAVPAPRPTQAEVEGTEALEETTEPEPAEPELPLAQEQAILKAEQYLQFQSFSRTGLIAQLEFEGFENADATFAVDYLVVDWNQQAALKAQQYMDNMGGFSKRSLTDQLLFEGFTQAETDFGVAAVGF